MDLLKQYWGWITANPWGFATFVVMAFGAGWGVAKRFYGERIELLKARLGGPNQHSVKESSVSKILYVTNGRHGPNLLGATTHDAFVGQVLSLRADIPENETLHVVLHGPPYAHLSDTSGAWHYNVVGVTNWIISKYQDNTSSPVQHFNAESGRAELELSFSRAGNVRVEVFECDSSSASWTKDIRVYDKS
ncbi:MAG: hypothetical protein ACYCZI_00890 [Metallibacterium scheffleri]